MPVHTTTMPRRTDTHSPATADTTIDMYEKLYEFEPTALRRGNFFSSIVSLSLLGDKQKRFSCTVYARAVSLKFALMQRHSMYAID